MTKAPTTKPANHHDLIFKYAYSSSTSAVELLELAFSKLELSRFNLDKLDSAKDSFHDQRADLVFMLPFKKSNIHAKICFLIEHKSEYKIDVFYQMLSYQASIMGEVFKAKKKACVVVPVLFYHGKKPWQWPKSFHKGFLGDILPKMPLSMQKDVLDFSARVIDTHDPKVDLAIESDEFKTRGFLNILKRCWDLKLDEGLLSEVLSLFNNWNGDRGDLLLSVGDYLWTMVPGMDKKLWGRLENRAVKEGIFQKGGYMDIREYIKEEGRQEGWQKGQQEGWQKGQQEGWQKGQQEGWQKGQQEGMEKGQQQLILKLLKRGMGLQSICKYTGLSEDEINKLKNNSSC